MPQVATYLHPETCLTTKEVPHTVWVGKSYLHYSQIRQQLSERLNNYPQLPLRKATLADYQTVHDPEYLSKIVKLGQDELVAEMPKLSMECTGYPYCLPGYLYGLGGMMAAVDAFKAGLHQRAFTFSLGGHHAYSSFGHGYCLLNPQAAAARYAQTQGYQQILIIDWDIHHGDGTQSIFANDPTVHCVSIHSLADLYMSKVASMEVGTTSYATQVGHHNIPILHAVFEDDLLDHLTLQTDFYRAAQSIPKFREALQTLPFSPDLILLFAGCDAHRDDCGSEITDWVEDDFRQLTEAVIDLAEQAGCPILSTQGGGYHLPSTIATTAVHVDTLAHYNPQHE